MRRNKWLRALMLSGALMLGVGSTVLPITTALTAEAATMAPQNNGGNGNGGGGNAGGGAGADDGGSKTEDTKSGGGKGDSKIKEYDAETAADVVTGGNDKIDSGKIQEAGKKLEGLKNGVALIIGIGVNLLMIWIPLTFVADILVAFIPPLDKFIGNGGHGPGASSGGPGGPGGKKSFHIQLTSGHQIRGNGGGGAGGPGGPGGAGGGSQMQWGRYLKERTVELIWAMAILGTWVTGTYMEIVNLLVKYAVLIVTKIIGFVISLVDGFIK